MVNFSMVEFGIFSDEGCIESGFYSRADAEASAAMYDSGDNVAVYAVCEEHEGQPAEFCEECLNSD